jgi:hypothetical protein
MLASDSLRALFGFPGLMKVARLVSGDVSSQSVSLAGDFQFTLSCCSRDGSDQQKDRLKAAGGLPKPVVGTGTCSPRTAKRIRF